MRPIVTVMLLTLAATNFAAEGFFTPAEFDAMAERLDATRDIASAEADAFAWGESYAMRGYLEAWRATGDRAYLRKLVSIADAIIATRDDRQPPGQRPSDHPVWTIDGKYTVARLTLTDRQGRGAILLRSIRYGYNDGIEVTVTPGEEPGTFTLHHDSEFWGQHLEADRAFENLSMDPKAERYFPRVINDLDYVVDPDYERIDAPDEPASRLIVALDIREQRSPDTVLQPVDSALLEPMQVPYGGYIGPIYSAMTAFAREVHETPELHAEFGEPADRLLDAAAESLDGWERLWREGPEEGQGYYLSIERGGGLWWDGVMAPMNYLGAVGQVLLDLWEVRGDERALDHATKIARLFRADCKLMPNGAYTFSYWPASVFEMWTREQALSLHTPVYRGRPVPDDLSHGAWSVEFAVMARDSGVVFNDEDIQRFADTFTRNLWRGPDQHLAMRVDGTGEGASGYDMAGTRWLDLTPTDPTIFHMMRSLYVQFNLDAGSYGQALGGYGRMLRWQRELEGR